MLQIRADDARSRFIRPVTSHLRHVVVEPPCLEVSIGPELRHLLVAGFLAEQQPNRRDTGLREDHCQPFKDEEVPYRILVTETKTAPGVSVLMGDHEPDPGSISPL